MAARGGIVEKEEALAQMSWFYDLMHNESSRRYFKGWVNRFIARDEKT